MHAADYLAACGFPWTPLPPFRAGGAAGRLRQAARRAVFDPVPRPLRPLARAAATLGWPLRALADAWHLAGLVRPGTFPGRSRPGLALSAWRAALGASIQPLEYFAYRLPDRADGATLPWLFSQETLAISRRHSERAAFELAFDKAAFADFADARGLPAPPVLARISAADPGAPPAPPSVVVKPLRGSNAVGVARWDRDGALWRVEGGAPADWQACAATLGPGDFLVQPLLAVHPDLARLGPFRGSPAIRLVTGLMPDGEVRLLGASLAFPPDGTVASNGGRRRLVELGTGRLQPPGPGRRHDLFGGDDTDDSLTGLSVPDWPEARALALRAHAAFPARAVLLGWDIAPTPDGPVLIETNAGVSFFLEQYETLEPAGTSEAARLLAAWLP